MAVWMRREGFGWLRLTNRFDLGVVWMSQTRLIVLNRLQHTFLGRSRKVMENQRVDFGDTTQMGVSMRWPRV